MTTQQAFTKMVKHLRKQGKQSISPRSLGCKYRGPNGLQCAVGCLIPDEVYKNSFEGVAVLGLYKTLCSTIFKNVDIGLLTQMQEVHDCFAPSQWENQFERVARRFHLTLPKKLDKQRT